MSDYTTSRAIALFVAFFGWVAVIGGAVLALWLIDQGNFGLLGVPAAMTVTVVGLVLVIAGQISRAILDSANHSKQIADNSKQILEEMRKKA